ncbi:YchJ family protein [Roseateles sp. GG27B]
MNPTDPCPCNSQLSYNACCGRWHQQFTTEQTLGAPHAEALMRSRYSAYVLDQRPYLLATWHASTRPEILEPNDVGLRWLGLEIKAHRLQDADHAVVEFVARSKLAGRAQRMREISQFVRVGGVWFYLDGEQR